jgi:hypothetical protein
MVFSPSVKKNKFTVILNAQILTKFGKTKSLLTNSLENQSKSTSKLVLAVFKGL